MECHKPAIKPGRYPQAVLSPSGDYLIAGNLAFDLEAKQGHTASRTRAAPRI